MTLPNFDWKLIRSIDGSQNAAFEALICQLAYSEVPEGSSRVRKGTPDAGVEFFCTLKNGEEWAWQAKFFDALGDSQWAQINDSVKTAIEKHPKLARYYVCVPVDRADPRIPDRTYNLDRWTRYEKRWLKHAEERDMSVEFVYWGNQELIDRISLPENRGRLLFWFDARYFDQNWFQERLDDAVKAAGPRYTPELNVELPIASTFDSFGRTQKFFDSLKAHAPKIHRWSRYFLREKKPDEKQIDANVDDRLMAELVKVDECAISAHGLAESVVIALVKLETNRSGPIEKLVSLSQIASEAVRACRAMHEAIWEARSTKAELEKEQAPKETLAGYHPEPLREREGKVDRLWRSLHHLESFLDSTLKYAKSPVMVLTGRAGTGKSHLLCDVASQRVSAGLPTILLMGHQFLSKDPPWSQALKLLDFEGYSADQFLGALESAAQTVGERALIMVDAINEGAGRTIWPAHLASFLAQCERSDWISVVLSIRTSYEEAMIPKETRNQAATVAHYGFAEHEYEASKTFFDYYGIERPSAPILIPEFDNPLFLKTLCLGLQNKKPPRLPRGLQGISETFRGYLSAVNASLAERLDYDPAENLVERSVERFAERLAGLDSRWLVLADAKELVDISLPGRGFEDSLFQALVSEGVLVREMAATDKDELEEVVLLGYERLSDHLIVHRLLDLHFRQDRPKSAFSKKGPLARYVDDKNYVPHGVLEAFCIQIPERIGKELFDLVPQVLEAYEFSDAFCQSLIWRRPDAFYESTFRMIGNLIASSYHRDQILDSILTLAIIPEHPLNAIRLNKNLLRYSMADRDAWWSTFLHSTWGGHGAVDRIVDWAWSVEVDQEIEDESVDLCSTVLAWFFTTSNRFLRDRATKALANLLTNRLKVASRIVERFHEVDDPYVTDRVFGSVYGAVLRSSESSDLGSVAQLVFDIVFKEGRPPPNILLRDYARGIVEQALLRGLQVEGDMNRILPPYKSDWPHIPTKKEISPYTADWSKGSYDSGSLDWSRNMIATSVFHDDFSHYVIGEHSLRGNWISTRLGKPRWKSTKIKLSELVKRFTPDQRKAWDRFEQVDEKFRTETPIRILFRFDSASDEPSQKSEESVAAKRRYAGLKGARTRALKALINELDERKRNRFVKLFIKEMEGTEYRPKGILSEPIKRFILWRAFDLGWTVERFGNFDRNQVDRVGRESKKAERIGKKYQWIAYHEIFARISDRFQFWDGESNFEEAQGYKGPWQSDNRDIDPSCILPSTSGGTTWSEHKLCWWAPVSHLDWRANLDHIAWIRSIEDVPEVDPSILVTNPQDDSNWVNLHCSLTWHQPVPAEVDRLESVRRQIWMHLTGYLVRAEDQVKFMQWAEGVDFLGGWMPDIGSTRGMFLGEHPASSAAVYFQNPYYSNDGWIRPRKDCPVSVLSPAAWYASEISSFDCSVKDNFSLHIPSKQVMEAMKLKWSGRNAEFLNDVGHLSAFDPAAQSNGPNAFLMNRRELTDHLAERQLGICWVIIGEKQVLQSDWGQTPSPGRLRISGASALSTTKEGLKGFLQCKLEQWDETTHQQSETSVGTIPIH